MDKRFEHTNVIVVVTPTNGGDNNTAVELTFWAESGEQAHALAETLKKTLSNVSIQGTFDTRLTTATVATQSIYGDGRTYLSREFDADVYSLSVETSANPAN